MNQTYLRIGVIARPHGVRGAVKVTPLTDDVTRFSGLSEAYLERRGVHTPLSLDVLSVGARAVLAQLNGIDSVEQAEALRGAYLCVPRQEAIQLPPDTWFVADLIGCAVSDTAGRAYGCITDVLETGANDVYVIGGGKLLVPALKKVLHEVDIANKRIILCAEVLTEVGLFED